MRLVCTMSSDEAVKDQDIANPDEDSTGDDKDQDVVLRDYDEESSSGEDDESESEEDDDEETDDEGVENTDNVDEGVSEEEDETEGEEDGEEDDSDDEEDEDEEDEQGEEVDNADISSGDENSDRCPICLNSLRKQDIGTPESCDHSFCLECIQEWSKNVNTCPVDRQIFRIILARHAGEEKIFKQFPVEDRQQEKEEEEEDPTYCEVCGQSNREDRLLLCDRCDLGYHCDCLDPPLASVPVHEWFCPDCQQSRHTVDSEPHSAGRQIARTTVSERVRRLIAEARAERAERRRRVAAMIQAQEALEGVEPLPGPSSSGTVSPATAEKKKTTRKRKTYRRKTTRRKTTKKRKTKRKTGKKTKTRKRKTKGKRKTKKVKKPGSSTGSPALARTAIYRGVTSVKGRIADKLGLSKPPAGRSIPMQKLPPSGTRQEGTARSSFDHGASSLSILGSKDELYLFADQEGEERQPGHRPAIPAERLLSKSAKSSHKPLSFSPIKKKIVVKEAPTSSPHTSVAVGGFDLLGSILQNQDLLYKGSKHVTINRDGSLSAASSSTSLSISPTTAKATVSAVSTTSSTQLSSANPRNGTSGQGSSLHSSHSGRKPGESSSEFKLKLSKNVYFRSLSSSDSESTEKSEAGSNTQQIISGGSKIQNSLQLDLATEVLNFSDSASSVEELQTVDADDDLLIPVKKEDLNNCEDIFSSRKSNSLLLETESTSSCMGNLYVGGTETFGAVKSEGEVDISRLVKAICENSGNDCTANASYTNTSPGEHSGPNIETKFKATFSEALVTEQESKPSEGSSNELDHSLSINNSPEVGSRESDSVLATIVNNSSRPYASDVNSVADLEADAVFSNNARLNAEEDVGNNGVGFSATANSQSNLRNFAAVARGLNNVHDDSAVGIMKRNFDLLVSTSTNLAGYESGDENENIERFIRHPNDREEGEASDSNEEGEVREEDRRRPGDEQEDGEIVDEEERERDRWALGGNACEDDENEDSGGLDVNAIHIEEMEIGTFRKRSMSQNEDNNNEGSKKMKTDEGTPLDTETKQDSESDKESDSDEDSNPGQPVRSFMLANLLTSLKSSELDGNKDNTEKKEEEYKIIKEAPKRQEEEKEKEDFTIKPISILDFIGDSAKKFGLEIEDTDTERQSFGQARGGTSYSGGNSFGYRGSRPYANRRQIFGQREIKDDDVEGGHGETESAPTRPYDRRRGSWQEEERDRHRSGSRDSQSFSHRSGVHEAHSGKSHYGRKEDTGRKGDSSSRDRSRKSRSRSGSPRRRAEKRRGVDSEEKNKHSRKGKKSRWDNENDGQEENVERVEKQDKKVDNKQESSGLPTTQTNGHPPAQDRQPYTSGHYQPHQYPPGVTAYSYQGAPVPHLPGLHPHAQPPPGHPHHIPLPGVPYSHSASLGQPPYTQTQHGLLVQQAAQTRPHHPEGKHHHHQGYQTTYYPPPPPTSIVPKVPPPPTHPYPRQVYPSHYPLQPGQPHAHVNSNPQITTTSQPHSGYPRYPQTVAHPYPLPVPHPTYPPAPVAPGTISSAAYISAATAVPPQQSVTASGSPAVPRHSYHTGATKQEPSLPRTSTAMKLESSVPRTSTTQKQEPTVPRTSAAMKQESSVPRTSAAMKHDSFTSGSNLHPVSAHSEPQRHKEPVKESTSSNMKPARTSYPISPPSAPIKGVTTYDKVDSSILLNEVKKGFRQLVEDAVRCALKGPWSNKKVTKEEYKDIFKRAVEKVCGSKETVVHQEKIQLLVNAYVMKARKTRKAQPTSN